MLVARMDYNAYRLHFLPLSTQEVIFTFGVGLDEVTAFIQWSMAENYRSPVQTGHRSGDHRGPTCQMAALRGSGGEPPGRAV